MKYLAQVVFYKEEVRLTFYLLETTKIKSYFVRLYD